MDPTAVVVVGGGHTVHPAEVEAVLLTHPAVADCAVIGVPEATGEPWAVGEPEAGQHDEVGAVVVLRSGHKLAAGELARHVRRHLPPFAVPTRWWLRPGPLPRDAAGAVARRTLRADLPGDPPPAGEQSSRP